MLERPFKILGVQQVAIGAPERANLRTLWVDLLGAESQNTFQSVQENVDEEVLQLGEGVLTFELDLMQPLDPEKKPRVDTPALNHIGLWVDQLEVAFAWLQKQGVRFTPGGIRIGASGHKVCFIHPKSNESHPIAGQGVLVELVQAPPKLLQRLTEPS